MKRREFIGLGTLGVVASIAGYNGKDAISGLKVNRSVRFAHFTDIHFEPVKTASDGLMSALRHMQSLDDKPDFLMTGGDHVMDSSAATKERTDTQFNALHKIFKDECNIPIKYCIGNHDVWGLNKEQSETTGQEKLWGKKKPLSEFKLEQRYYSFDWGKWHFVVLDSTFPVVNGYTAKLDEEQFEWLEKDLASATDKYIVVVSHIPILSVAAYFDGEHTGSGNWVVPGAWMHIDARRIKDLFRKHPNVKLAISGHLHMCDRVEFEDVTYICAGAVSGAWWSGPYEGCHEGYSVFDLYDDGAFTYDYINYLQEVEGS